MKKENKMKIYGNDKTHLESMYAYWYAVLEDADDNDWGYGSFNYEEAVKMARAIGKDARIAVICEGEDPICERIILQEDF